MLASPSLCGGSVIVLQQPAQPCATGDRSVALSRRRGGEEQLVAHALMVPFEIVCHELATARRNDRSPNKIIRSRHDSLIVRTKRSAYAFRFGECGGSRTASTPVAASVWRNASLNSGSRSWSKKRFPRKQPSIGSVIWRPHCVTQVLSGSDPMPAISTRRVARSMTNRTA